MIDRGVTVLGGTSEIPEGSVCSLLTYDTQEEGFVTSQETNSQYFEKGVISYIPKNMSLNTHELIGSKIDDGEESDFDFGFAESEEDPDEGL